MSFLLSGLPNVLSGLLLVAEITSAVYPRHLKLSVYSRASDFTSLPATSRHIPLGAVTVVAYNWPEYFVMF